MPCSVEEVIRGVLSVNYLILYKLYVSIVSHEEDIFVCLGPEVGIGGVINKSLCHLVVDVHVSKLSLDRSLG